MRREAGDGRIVEQRPHAQLDAAGVAQPRPHLHRQQRVAAEIEEAVVPADGVNVEEIRPHRRDGLFELAAGSDAIACGSDLARRRRQRAAIDLAGRRQRQPFQPNDRLGHHVVGQAGAQEAPDLVSGRRCAATRGDVADEHRVGLRIAPQCGDGRGHVGVLCDRRFDLPELDAEAPHFHLRIDASLELQRTVGPHTGQIARAIESAPVRVERVGHEPLRRERGTAEIPSRQSGAAEEQLARAAARRRPHARIEHVHALAGRGSSDRDRSRRCVGPASPRGHLDRRFCRTVQVIDRVRDPLERALRQLGRQQLAADEHVSQTSGLGEAGLFQNGGQLRRDEREHGDVMARDQPDDLGAVRHVVGRREHEARAADQGTEELPDRDVERARRDLKHGIARIELVS